MAKSMINVELPFFAHWQASKKALDTAMERSEHFLKNIDWHKGGLTEEGEIEIYSSEFDIVYCDYAPPHQDPPQFFEPVFVLLVISGNHNFGISRYVKPVSKIVDLYEKSDRRSQCKKVSFPRKAEFSLDLRPGVLFAIRGAVTHWVEKSEDASLLACITADVKEFPGSQDEAENIILRSIIGE
jgi:hypothetical protein